MERNRKRKVKVKVKVIVKPNKCDDWLAGYQFGGRLEPWISLTLRSGAGLLCGAETSVFFPILANFQWFLVKN